MVQVQVDGAKGMQWEDVRIGDVRLVVEESALKDLSEKEENYARQELTQLTDRLQQFVDTPQSSVSGDLILVDGAPYMAPAWGVFKANLGGAGTATFTMYGGGNTVLALDVKADGKVMHTVVSKMEISLDGAFELIGGPLQYLLSAKGQPPAIDVTEETEPTLAAKAEVCGGKYRMVDRCLLAPDPAGSIRLIRAWGPDGNEVLLASADGKTYWRVKGCLPELKSGWLVIPPYIPLYPAFSHPIRELTRGDLTILEKALTDSDW